jgi:hypothetical protein
MSLLMYSDAECTTQLVDNDLKLAHNGFTGGAEYIELYIQNSDIETYSYADINIGLDINPAVSGYKYKSYIGSKVLSEQEWDEIETGPAQILALSGETIHKVTFRVYLTAGSDPECFYDGELKVSLTATQSTLA